MEIKNRILIEELKTLRFNLQDLEALIKDRKYEEAHELLAQKIKYKINQVERDIWLAYRKSGEIK